MGTITTRKRKDGFTTYDAQIRVMRKGVKVYQESQTFDWKTTAQACAGLFASVGHEKARAWRACRVASGD